MQTKNLKTELLDKYGKTKSSSIQKHKPEFNKKICFIKLESGYNLLCQEDHPLIINRNDEDIVKEAKELNKDIDRIWIDDEILYNMKRDTESIIKPMDLIDALWFVYNFSIQDKDLNLCEFKLDSNILKCSGNYHEIFINYFSEKMLNFVFFDSFILFQQLIFIFKKNSYEFDYIFRDNGERIEFIFTKLKKSDNITISKKYDKIIDIIEIKNYKGYLYDIKTDSEEFMLSCVQNHNSFHTGGAVILNSVDIISELMSNIDDDYKGIIEKNFEQKVDTLYNKGNDLVIININRNIFKLQPIKEEDEFFILPLGYFEMDIGKIKIPITIEQETKVYKGNEVEDNIDNIVITFGKGDTLFHVKAVKEDYGELSKTFRKLCSGKSPYSSVSNLYLKFFKILESTGGWDSSHLEVLVSNVLRAEKNPQKAARLIEPFEEKMFSIKKLPSVISWSLGLAFEDFGKAVREGLISDRGPESPVEKVMFGMDL